MRNLSTDQLESRYTKLITQHKQYKLIIGPQNKTKRWAVWMLLGALLALLNRAIDNRDKGDYLGNHSILRLALEYSMQINFFIHPAVKNRAVQDWWKVYNPLHPNYTRVLSDVEYRLYAKNSNERNFLDRYIYKKYHKSNSLPTMTASEKLARDMLSLYMHPSYNLTRELFATDRNNGSYTLYEYNSKNLQLARYSTDTVLGLVESAFSNCAHLYK